MGFFDFKCKSRKKKSKNKKSVRKYRKKSKKSKSVRKYRRKNVRKSRKNRKSRYGKRVNKSMRRKSMRRKSMRKFGASPGLNRTMGNYENAKMSIFDHYTGAGADQRSNHAKNISANLQNNFYNN